jgi:molecular chaperone GrpE (heat shock protein)
MRWLKRVFTGDREEHTLSSLITSTNTQTQVQLAEQKKGLRRLSLAQKQQGEAVERLEQQVLSLKSSLEQCHGVVFDHARIIELLDGLHKIRTAASSSGGIVSLTDQVIGQLLRTADLKPIAQQGAIYPEEGCEVLNGFPHEHQLPGAIHEIIQQGYRTSTGDLIRIAKVVVYCKPDFPEEDSVCE